MEIVCFPLLLQLISPTAATLNGISCCPKTSIILGKNKTKIKDTPIVNENIA
jgi:hypothetical protein